MILGPVWSSTWAGLYSKTLSDERKKKKMKGRKEGWGNGRREGGRGREK